MNGQRVTLRDVAERAGVHVSTVSRALNNLGSTGRIPAATVERIQQAARDVGYLPNAVGRALRTGRSGVIAMVVPDVANLYQAGINHAAELVLTEHGYSLLLASTGERIDIAQQQTEAMVSAQAEGFLYGAARLDDPVVARIREADIPVVLYNRTDGLGDLTAVLPDDERGIDAAVDHLLELGHREIGHVAGPQDVSSGLARQRAFDAALQRRGLRGVSLPAPVQNEDEGARVGRLLLEQHPTLTAVIAANDRLALGLIDTLRELGRRCPEDVSVVGFNDMPYAERFVPPLTTLRVSQADIGQVAAEALVAAITDPGYAAATTMIAPELVVRGSTAPAPVAALRRP